MSLECVPLTDEHREGVPGAEVASAREDEPADASCNDEFGFRWTRPDLLVACDDDQAQSADDRESKGVSRAERNGGQTNVPRVQHVLASQRKASAEREIVLVDEEPRRHVRGHQAAVAAS